MKRFDYYCGIVMLVCMLLLGEYALRYVSAQSPAAVPKIITAQEFRLVDGSGHIRSQMLVDADGSLRFKMMDKGGQSRIILALVKDGTAAFALNDASEANSFGVTASPDGSGLKFESTKGSISLTDLSGGPGLRVINKAGPRTYLDSSGIISVDKKGDVRATYGTNEKGDPYAVMLDGDKTIIWSVPKGSE